MTPDAQPHPLARFDSAAEALAIAGAAAELAGGEKGTVIDQVRAVEAAMAAHALRAWAAANARHGLSDCDALIVHADALTRWSERLRMALRGDIAGDEEWLAAVAADGLAAEWPTGGESS